jgi:sec-independent protein translocase protein TatA
MFGNLFSGWHIVILVALVLLLFGATKLPALAKGLGESLRILRTETRRPADGQAGDPTAEPVPAPGSDPGSDPPATRRAGEPGSETDGGSPGASGADPAQRD